MFARCACKTLNLWITCFLLVGSHVIYGIRCLGISVVGGLCPTLSLSNSKLDICLSVLLCGKFLSWPYYGWFGRSGMLVVSKGSYLRNIAYRIRRSSLWHPGWFFFLSFETSPILLFWEIGRRWLSTIFVVPLWSPNGLHLTGLLMTSNTLHSKINK